MTGSTQSSPQALTRQVYLLLQQGRLEQARQLAEQATQQFPGDPQVLDMASEVNLAMGAPQVALDFITQAVEASDDAALRIKKAVLLVRLGMRGEARILALHAAAQHPQQPRILWQAGKICSDCNDHAEATRLLSASLELGTVSPQVRYDLAVSQFFSGDFEAAERNLDQLIASVPRPGHALYLRSTLRRQTAGNNHVQALRAQAEQPVDNPEAHAAGLYALSKELEDLGEYPDAFQTLQRAARLKRSALKGYSVTPECDTLDAIRALYTPQAYAQLHGHHDEAGAIFIVGLPRTGTTLVERALSSCSSLGSAGELLDFGLVLASLSQQAAAATPGLSPAQASLRIDFSDLGRRYMERARQAAQGAGTFVDKMPVNALYCGLIHQALPNAKIIHLVRDPMDACYAAYKTLFYNAYHYSYDLDELASYYIAHHRLMAHWHRLIPDAILDVSYETLVAEPEAQARRILHWCGLQPDLPLFAPPDASRPFASASAAQVRQPVNRRSVGAWRRHEAGLAGLRARLQEAGIPIIQEVRD
jgi:tetratricopeptide (TPR) repeat protein